MTLTEWQKNEQLVKWAAEMLRTREGREFVAMLKDSHTENAERVDLGNAIQNTADLAKIYGYNRCLNNIQAATRLHMEKQVLLETFGAVPPKQQKKK